MERAKKKVGFATKWLARVLAVAAVEVLSRTEIQAGRDGIRIKFDGSDLIEKKPE